MACPCQVLYFLLQERDTSSDHCEHFPAWPLHRFPNVLTNNHFPAKSSDLLVSRAPQKYIMSWPSSSQFQLPRRLNLRFSFAQRRFDDFPRCRLQSLPVDRQPWHLDWLGPIPRGRLANPLHPNYP